MLRNRNELDKKKSFVSTMYVRAKGINVHPIYLDICQYGAKYLCFKVEIILKEREVAFLSPSNMPSTFEFFGCAVEKFKC